MRLISYIFLYLLCQQVCSQGLNGEVDFNNDYNQNAVDVITVNEYSYIINQEYQSNGFFTTAELVKVDTLGNIVWSTTLAPMFAEIITPKELIASPNGGVYILAKSQDGCDWFGGCNWFIQEYSLNGTTLWNKIFNDINCYGTTFSGLSSSQNGLHVNFSSDTISKLYELDLNGQVTDSITVVPHKLEKIIEFPPLGYVSFLEDSLFGIDEFGMTQELLIYSSDIKNVTALDDTLFVLTTDSIFKYDVDFQKLIGENISGFSNYSNLKLNANEVNLISHDSNNQHIIKLNHNFGFEEVLSIPVSLNPSTPKDFNEYHFITATNFSLTMFQSVRLMDFSLLSSENVQINSTDIGIIDIEATEVNAELSSYGGSVYNFEIHADVLLKNFGNNTLNSCNINHYIQDGAACNHVYYFKSISNLNLPPGDSVWLSLGLIQSNTHPVSGDTLLKEVCFYTSHPNKQTDLYVSNDEYCKNILLGYANVEDHFLNENIHVFPNPATDFIYVELNTNQKVNYKLFNVERRAVLSGELETSKIDIQSLSKGIYHIYLESNQERFISKIVIQ